MESQGLGIPPGLPHLFYQPVDAGQDSLFDVLSPFHRRQAINRERPCFIPSFFPDAVRRNVRHHVVRVAGDPRVRILLLHA